VRQSVIASFFLFKTSSIFFFCFLISGCANVVAPTGGERDSTPPTVISSAPENLTTNFKEKEIRISLSEFFSLNNPASEIYLSPTANGKLKWRTRKKNLFIILPDSLKENTTYTIHFGNSIVDISEGNKLEGFNYVFSTGPVIDSFRIQGILTDAKTQKPQKGSLVMLYSSADDSVVAKSKPDYFARTDESGQFVLDHLHEGNYRLFCLSDQNLNYLYDQPNEEIAFVDSMISVDDTTAFYSLNSFLTATDKTVLLSTTTTDNKKISFAFNHEVKDFPLQLISDSSQILFQSKNKTGDTLYAWIATKQSDSIFFQLNLNSKTDTIGVRLKSTVTPTKGLNPKFSIRTNLVGSKNNYGLMPSQKLELYFNYPLKSVAKDILPSIVIDTSKESKRTLILKRIDSLTQLPYASCNFEFQPDLKYKVIIPAGLFEDVYGNKNDSAVFEFKQLSTTETGNLKLTVTLKDSVHHYIAQLKFANSMIKEWNLESGKNIFSLQSLNPGAYKLQFIRDENGNSKWDSGDYWKKKQPEKIILYNKEITVRPNWDLEIDTEVGATSLGKMKK